MRKVRVPFGTGKKLGKKEKGERKMGMIYLEEVLGFWTDYYANKAICVECALKSDRKTRKKLQDYQMIEVSHLDGYKIYICNRCGKELGE